MVHPYAAASAGTVVAIGEEMGEGKLLAFDAAAGLLRVVLTTTDQLIAVELSRDGSTAYAILGDRTAARASRLVAIDVATGAVRELAELSQYRVQRVDAFFSSLDASTLALISCQQGCTTLLFEAATGAELPSLPAGRPPFGLTTQYAVGERREPQLRELDTGDSVAGPEIRAEYVTSELVLAKPGRELLVGQLTGSPSWGILPRPATAPPEIELLDLTRLTSLGVVGVDLYAFDLHAPTESSTVVDLPDGWVLVQGITHRGDETVSYFALRVQDGHVRALPAMGEFDRP